MVLDLRPQVLVLRFCLMETPVEEMLSGFGVIITNVTMLMLVVLGQRSGSGRPGAAQDPVLIAFGFLHQGLSTVFGTQGSCVERLTWLFALSSNDCHVRFFAREGEPASSQAALPLRERLKSLSPTFHSLNSAVLALKALRSDAPGAVSQPRRSRCQASRGAARGGAPNQ